MDPTPTIEFHLTNIGSDLSRVLDFLKRDEKALADEIISRIEKTIDSIVQEESQASALSEIQNLKDAITQFRSKERIYEVDIVELEGYCIPFITRIMHM